MTLPDAASEIIQSCIDGMWGDVDAQAIMGLLTRHNAYDAPGKRVARTFTDDTNPFPMQAVCAQGEALPYRVDQFTHLLVTHVVEFSHHPIELVQECARVLEPQGRMILIVANRSGLWARADGTVLGDGQPYSYAQICTLLDQAKLKIMHTRHCLLTPPMRSEKWFTRVAKITEPLAPFCPILCGVHVLEIQKQVRGLPPGTRSPVLKKAKQPQWGKPALPGL